MGKYETSSLLKEVGLLDGGDMTTEAGITKLMIALGNCKNRQEVIKRMETNWRGELS
jgi:L-asparaginase